MYAYQGFPSTPASTIDYKFPAMPGFDQPVSDTFNGYELTIHRVQQDGYCAKFSYKIELLQGHLIKSGTFHALGGMGTTMEQEFHRFVNQIYDRYHR